MIVSVGTIHKDWIELGGPCGIIAQSTVKIKVIHLSILYRAHSNKFISRQ